MYEYMYLNSVVFRFNRKVGIIPQSGARILTIITQAHRPKVEGFFFLK